MKDKIVMCPKNLNDDGSALLPIEVCSLETINVIDKVTCSDFEIPCPSGEKFYFMLTTPGEVYT